MTYHFEYDESNENEAMALHGLFQLLKKFDVLKYSALDMRWGGDITLSIEYKRP